MANPLARRFWVSEIEHDAMLASALKAEPNEFVRAVEQNSVIGVMSGLPTIHSEREISPSSCKVRSKMSKLDRVIASRLLTCAIDGHPQEVQVNLGEPFEDNGAFTCPYEIVIGGQSTVLEITGIDGIQALQLALFMVGSSLRSLSRASDWHWADKVGSGFPSTLKEPLFGETSE